MRIGYITSQYARASDTFIRGEVKELRRLGHTVVTFSVRRAEQAQVVDAEVATEQANTHYLLAGPQELRRLPLAAVVEAVRSPRRFARSLAMALAIGPGGLKGRVWQIAYLLEASLLAQLIRHTGVQHIHDHIGENSGTVAMLASVLAGVSYSMTVHGPSMFYAPERWGLGTKIKHAAFVACISEFCRSQCMAFSAVDDWDRLKIVRCGVDERFLAETPAAVSPTNRLVCVGRLSQEKGHVPLIRAVAKLVKEGVSLQLILVGDGPMRPLIERLIREHSLGSHVTITGWRNSAEVREEILQARALVVPSFAEGLPVVIMEALALGRPVVSTSIAGIPELVQPGVDGWLVPAGSVAALADALRSALQTPVERLTEMGLAGRRQVLEMHDARCEAKKLVQLFRQAIGEIETAQLNAGGPVAPAEARSMTK